VVVGSIENLRRWVSFEKVLLGSGYYVNPTIRPNFLSDIGETTTVSAMA
jgi:hypothetical protein